MGKVQKEIIKKLEEEGKICGIGQWCRECSIGRYKVTDDRIKILFEHIKGKYPNATITTKTTLYNATIKLNRECDK